VFVLTLAVLVGLVALVAALASTNRASVRAQANRMEDRRARIMAESAVQRAMSELQQQDPARAMNGDKWATLGDRGDVAFEVGQDAFRLQILDASGRVDLNKADEEQLRRLPLTEEQIHSILDWREEAKNPRAQGAKDEFYNSLPTGYNTKLKPFGSVDELLLVKNVTPADLYTLERSQSQPLASGPAELPILSEMLAVDPVSADKNVNGEAKLDINAAKVDDIVALGIPKQMADAIMAAKGSGFQKLGDILKIRGMTKEVAKAIADNVTIGKDAQHTGLVNVNTAGEAVLSAVLGPDSSLTSAIVGRQGTGFKSLGELLDLPEFSVTRFAGVADLLCVSSRSFIVRVVGAAGASRVAAEATLVLEDDGNVRLAAWHPESFKTVGERWGWEQSPNQRVVLGTK
jgi:general secretion pathway protein K